MSWFRRAPIAPRDRHSYPQPEYVTVVSAEVQEWEFVHARFALRVGAASVLASAEARWLDQDEAVALIGELASLLTDDVNPDDRLDIRRAIALVQYGIDSDTGTQVVPPSGR